jgi:hypothetical protein
MFDLASLANKAGDFLKKAAEKAAEATNQAAEAVAKKTTELTGRETTAEEVKKAAFIAGAFAAGVAVLGALADPGTVGMAGGRADGFSGDWEGEATRFFAENGGSLNFETPYVDSEGQVYM